MRLSSQAVTVNGRVYRKPSDPIVVVCVDGLDPSYLDAAFAEDAAPFLRRLESRGWRYEARSAMPSFTNPNNVSIITGVAPAAHGIAGNYFYDPVSRAEVMMNDPHFLRVGTIPAALAAQGAHIAIVTAKDKLRQLLGYGLPADGASLCVSVERPTPAARDFLPAEAPGIYSAAASEAVFSAGLALLERRAPDLLYLSTTDYIQHKHAPGEREATAFVAMLDRYLAAMDARGVHIVVTADHGMSAKTRPDGTPNIVFLAEALDRDLPEAAARVILPITDPYVRHHGALGAFATVYLSQADDIRPARNILVALPGVEAVLEREDAARALELPQDRIGDLCILATADSVLGTRAVEHDLSSLDRPLRSHGGTHEQIVPFILNFEPPAELSREALRNFDAFSAALAGDAFEPASTKENAP